ncbi:hypothetical protein [Dermabacter hominis]
MIAPVHAYTGGAHRPPARVWILLSSIALALLVLAPGVALVLAVFPIVIQDPPQAMPALRGVNTLFFTAMRSVLVCVVAALTANVLVFAATPAIVRALKRCPSKGAARFGAIAALLFLAGALVSAAIWALVLAPVVVAFSPDPESLRDQLPRFNLLLIFVPFVIDSVRFLVMPLAGIAVSAARQRDAAPPNEPTMAPVPR